jgi:hypothetical protein
MKKLNRILLPPSRPKSNQKQLQKEIASLENQINKARG